MTETSRISLYNNYPEPTNTRYEVLQGLTQKQKTLPAKYFYDQKGSLLFEKITQLPEYYPTRTEIKLLQQYADEIANIVGQHATLLEFGSGASKKIRILLDALKPSCYIPMDISTEFLMSSAQQLADDYPWLSIQAACVDYSQDFQLPENITQRSEHYLGFFPGSSIGNFTPDEASGFLGRAHKLLGKGRYLLLGVDLDKEEQILQAAYDDQQGITALFNKNILTHINHLIGSNFETEKFDHKVVINKDEQRVEMHLKSKIDQMIRVGDNMITLKSNETIHTENSHKYTLDSIKALCGKNNFSLVKHWKDNKDLFSIILLKAE